MFSFFQKARRFTVNGGTFNNVQGNQYNRTTIVTTTQAQSESHLESNEEEAEYQQFYEFRRADIRLIRAIYCNQASAYDDCEKKIFHGSSIHRNDNNTMFTVMAYTGRDALEVWKREFKWYSQALAPHRVHLFGLERSQVPRLIFTGELLPAAHLLECIGYWGKIYLESLTAQFQCSGNEIWLDTQQGVLCQGPEGPECDLPPDFYFFEYQGRSYPTDCDLLEEDVCLRFFANCRSKDLDRAIIEGLSLPPHREEVDVSIDDADICSTDTVLPIVTTYSLLSATSCLHQREVLKDGTVRLTLKGCTEKIKLWICWKEESGPWLAQALSLFNARRSLTEDDLVRYKILVPQLELTGTLTETQDGARWRQDHPYPIYLFIRPLCSTPSLLSSGGTSSLHFWSFDKTGQSPLSAVVCDQLGLPIELMLSGRYTCYSYSNETYRLVRQYQLARGFDPKTTDFVKALEYPLYVEGAGPPDADANPEDSPLGFWSALISPFSLTVSQTDKIGRNILTVGI